MDPTMDTFNKILESLFHATGEQVAAPRPNVIEFVNDEVIAEILKTEGKTVRRHHLIAMAYEIQQQRPEMKKLHSEIFRLDKAYQKSRIESARKDEEIRELKEKLSAIKAALESSHE